MSASLLRQPATGLTVYPGVDAVIHEILQCARLPPLEVICVKARSRVCVVRGFAYLGSQLRTGTKGCSVLHPEDQPRVHMRVSRRASVSVCIGHVAVVIRADAIGSAGSTLGEGDVRGYPRLGRIGFAVVGALAI